MNRPSTLRLVTLLLALAILLLVSSSAAMAQSTPAPVRSVVQTPGEPPGDAIEPGDTLAPTGQAANPPGQPTSLLPMGTFYTVTLGAWRNLRPTESYLRDVSMLPPSYSVNCSSPDQKSKGWIVGESGVILSYCNGIWDHAIVVESIPTNLWGVQAISPTLGVAVGEGGTVLLYLWDKIAQDWVWTKSPIPLANKALYSVSMVPDGTGSYTGWAVGESGTLVRGRITPTVIDGHPSHTYTWEDVTANYPLLPKVNYYFGLQMLSPTEGWTVGNVDGASGVILHWDGTTWSVFQQVKPQYLLGLHMISATDGWTVGGGGVIYHFDGSTWSRVASPITTRLVGVGFSPDGEGWACGDGGKLVKYSNGRWSLFTDLRTDYFDFYALDFTSGHGWMVGFHASAGMGGQILEYDDGLWLAVTPPTDNRLNGLAVVTDNNAWAVGAADSAGGTIIHWDGRHWQRWYQHDLPIPAVDLYTIDMTGATNGWAAGDPPVSEAPAVFLHWDGYRWAQPRYDAPVNVRVNALDMLNRDFGWAVADTGNAVAKYDSVADYWNALHTCGGSYYQLRSTSIVPANNIFGWDAWAVGTSAAATEWFLRYQSGCSTGYAWDWYQSPIPCEPKNTDGATATKLRGIKMEPGPWGYATGNYRDRASVYSYTNGTWETIWCHPDKSLVNPTRFYSVDVIPGSQIAWFGGFQTANGRKVAYIMYRDINGMGYGGMPFPWNGRNIYHRPILNLRMSSDTMGWAVGEGEDPKKLSVLYQYPYPNFTLGNSPSTRAVIPGGSTFYTITTNSLGGFNADVTLALLDAPPGVAYSFVPGTVNAQSAAILYITTSASTPLGVYDIPMLGYAVFRSGDYDIPVWRVAYLRLTVTNVPVYSVTPLHGPAGTTVTISGAGFGSDPGAGSRSTTANHVILAGQQITDSSVLSWSETQITVQTPDDPTLFPRGPVVGDVSVQAGGYASNADFSFQLENHINSVTTRLGASAITVTVVGTSLGNDPGTLFRSTYYEHVSLNSAWIPNADVKSWSNNVITFTAPVDTPSGLLTVTSNGYESNAVTFENGSRVYLPVITKR